jgi:hypothetical protein
VGYVFKIIIVAFYLTHHLRCVNFFGDAKAGDAKLGDAVIGIDNDILGGDGVVGDPFFSKSNVAFVTIVASILRHVQSCSCNGYEISELIRDQKTIRVKQFRGGRVLSFSTTSICK